MATLPQTGDDLDLINFQFEEQPGYTHKLDIERSRVSGMTDERDALYQAIYLILNVERYAFPIYSRNYGSVEDWSFETGRNWVRASFTVATIYGELEAVKEVEI